MTVKVEFSINTVELEVKYHLNAAAICLRQQINLVQRRQFQHQNQSQAAKVRRQYHEILTARA